jgi:hypothetical protein
MKIDIYAETFCGSSNVYALPVMHAGITYLPVESFE